MMFFKKQPPPVMPRLSRFADIFSNVSFGEERVNALGVSLGNLQPLQACLKELRLQSELWPIFNKGRRNMIRAAKAQNQVAYLAAWRNLLARLYNDVSYNNTRVLLYAYIFLIVRQLTEEKKKQPLPTAEVMLRQSSKLLTSGGCYAAPPN